MPHTLGFDPLELHDHFKKHGKRLGILTVAEYQRRADVFLGGKRKITTLHHVRKQGDIVRYDIWSKEFGILSNTGVIRTYYKPNRATHGKPFHVCYYMAECNRTFVI